MRRGKPSKPKLRNNVMPPWVFGRARVSSKGWIVIPKEIRDELGIEPGDELSVTLIPPPLGMKQDRRLSSVRIHKIPEDLKERADLMCGMIPRRPGEPLMTEELLRERREEREREEQELKAYKRRRRRTA